MNKPEGNLCPSGAYILVGEKIVIHWYILRIIHPNPTGKCRKEINEIDFNVKYSQW